MQKHSLERIEKRNENQNITDNPHSLFQMESKIIHIIQPFVKITIETEGSLKWNSKA